MDEDRDNGMDLVELWVWPMYKAYELFGPASILISGPYFLLSIVLASLAVLGTIAGGVYMLGWILVG